MNLKRFQSVFAALLLPAAAAIAADDIPRSWRDISKPPLRNFKIQQPTRISLPNGMVIFLQEDHELPLISGTARIRGGSRDETAEKIGLADVYGQVWRTGGTKSRTGDQLDDFLESRAAKVETDASLDSTTISWDCLKGDFDDVFAVVADLLKNPEFREEKIGLAKNQLNTGIARRNDDSMEIAGRESRRIAYGTASPYGRVAEYATVAASERKDLIDWHKRFVHPNNIILGVVGDFDSKKMEARLRSAFGSLPKGPEAKRADGTFADPKAGVYLVPKTDVNQSSIRMVHLGIMRNNPDYYALEVMNEAFGGGSFSSRLTGRIRSKQGLAYYVSGRVGSAWDYPGLVTFAMGTKSGTTAQAIQSLFTEIEDLKKNPPTPDELDRSKATLLNSFIFRVDSKKKVLAERMELEFYGFPAEELEAYRTKVEKVTPADVERVSKKYLDRQKLAVLVVGNPKEFDKDLGSFGPVTTVDITIPTGKAKESQAAPASASTPAGLALLDKVITAAGGASKLREVKSIRQVADVVAQTPQGEMALQIESLSVFPDRVYQKMATPMGEIVMVATVDAGFMKMPGAVRDLPGSQKEGLLRDLQSKPFFVALNRDNPKYSFADGGNEKVGDVNASVLKVNAAGQEMKWFVDPASGHILRIVSQEMTGSGPAEQIVDFSDYREVAGVTVPWKAVIMQNGKKTGTMTVKEWSSNPNIDPALFEKPAQ